MDGIDQLAAYLRDYGSQARFAREINCSESHLSLVLARKRGLSVPLAKRVSTATGGTVPVRALVAEKLERAAELLGAAE